jgi:hypothetical protein
MKKTAMLCIMILLISSVLVYKSEVAMADPIFKQIQGVVLPNSTTGVSAYDPGPDNGWTYFYIQNRTEEGSGTDPLNSVAGTDYYDPEIHTSINDWKVGDECINVVNRDYGIYGVNHSGYLAFTNTTLDSSGVQSAYETELQKIPAPTMLMNGVGFINITWNALFDPTSLIAGYTIYRSTTNGTVSGDADWILVGGSSSSPVTDLYFNDTSVVSGQDYYYSLKVVITGYSVDNPLNVDNYECSVFGEGSELMISPVPGPGIDYIVVEYFDDSEVTNIDLNVGQSSASVIAQAYNSSGPTKVGAVEVDWSVDIPALGSVNPIFGTSTIFTANFLGGSTMVTAIYGSLTDTFIVTIAPPAVDYVILEYESNGTEIVDMVWDMGNPLEIQAAGYNNTGPTFVTLVTVTWDAIPIDTGNGTFNVSTGPTVLFSGTAAGLVEIRGTYAPGVYDNFTLLLQWGSPPTIDEIKITDVVGNEIFPLDLNILQSIQLFAWGFNTTAGIPVDPVSVDWSLDMGGTIDAVTGYSTNFTAGDQGADTTVTATYLTLMDDLLITINPPTIDYITITDSPDGTEYVIVQISPVGVVTFYASGYNNTGNTYVGLVIVTWSAGPPGLGNLNVTIGETATFTGNDSGGGMVLIAADDGTGHQDNFTIELLSPNLDYIDITDAPDGLPLDGVTIDVGVQITLYASGYNVTGGFIGLISVDWSQIPIIGNFSVDFGTSTIFTAGNNGDTAAITGSNNSVGVSDNIVLTVNAPTVDYMDITDTPGGLALDDIELVPGEDITFYASAYNHTVGYIGGITVNWTQNPNTLGDFSLVVGTFTTFNAGNSGGFTVITGTHIDWGLSDSFILTVSVPSLDYFEVTGSPGGAELDDVFLDVGEKIAFYASGYNNTAGYIGLILVDWSESPETAGVFSVQTGDSTNYTAELSQVSTLISASNSTFGMGDSFLLTVNKPVVDYVKIRDEHSNGGIEVIEDEFTLGDEISERYYCAGYNNTSGYIEEIAASWSLNNGIGVVDITSGTFTQFTATTPGEGILTADVGGISRYVTLTVNPEVDTTAPSAPTGLFVMQGDEWGTLVLLWNENMELDLTGYNLYRSNSSEGPYVRIGHLLTIPAYSDSGLSEGTYFYRVTALDEVPNESENSTTVSRTVEETELMDDGLPDEWERQFFGGLTQGPSDDFDSDNFTNREEYEAGSDPTDADKTPDDKDGDGFQDIWEIYFFGNLSQNVDGDFDGDGFTNLQEYEAGNDPSDDQDYPGFTGPDKKEDNFLSSFWWVFVIIILAVAVLLQAIVILRGKRPGKREVQEVDDGMEEVEEDGVDEVDEEADYELEDEVENIP